MGINKATYILFLHLFLFYELDVLFVLYTGSDQVLLHFNFLKNKFCVHLHRNQAVAFQKKRACACFSSCACSIAWWPTSQNRLSPLLLCIWRAAGAIRSKLSPSKACCRVVLKSQSTPALLWRDRGMPSLVFSMHFYFYIFKSAAQVVKDNF